MPASRRIYWFAALVAIFAAGFGAWAFLRPTRTVFATAGMAQVPEQPTPDMEQFRAATRELLERVRRAADKARDFDSAAALAALPPNPNTGFVYRFDDNAHLGKPTTEAPAPDSDPASQAASFEFDADSKIRWSVRDAKLQIENGIAKVRGGRGGLLYTETELAITRGDVGMLEMRVRAAKARSFVVGWARERVDTLWFGSGLSFNDQSAGIRIETSGLTDFQTYRIDLAAAVEHRLQPEDVIKRVFLAPTDAADDVVEIDYLRLLPRDDRYRAAPFGAQTATLDEEMRRTLYMRTPQTVAFELDAPEGPLHLHFGAAALRTNEPMEFGVTLRAAGRSEKIFSEKRPENSTWSDHRLPLPDWARGKIQIEFSTQGRAGNVAFWSSPKIVGAPRNPVNIVILLEDAFRADRLSMFGHTRPTTPAKDAFFATGARFRNAFSQAPQTRPSCPALMTSLYPSATGVATTTDMLHENYVTLAEVLRAQGYATAGFVQNRNAGPASGLHQGYETILPQGKVGSDPSEMYGKDLIDWLDRNGHENFFLYLHVLDPHGPYEPHEPYRAWAMDESYETTPAERSKDLDPKWVKKPSMQSRERLYDGEIRENDEEFGKFIKTLRDKNMLENTVFIFLSDHGEYLGEHNVWAHREPGLRPVVNVPLLIAGPKIPNLEFAQPAQLIDVMPTVLELAGVKADALPLEGDSLVPLLRGENAPYWDGRMIVSEEVNFQTSGDPEAYGSLFLRDWQFIRSSRFGNKMDAVDPGDKSGVATQKIFNTQSDKSARYNVLRIMDDESEAREEIDAAVAALKMHNRQLRQGITRGEDVASQMDPATIKQLKALGYLSMLIDPLPRAFDSVQFQQ